MICVMPVRHLSRMQRTAWKRLSLQVLIPLCVWALAGCQAEQPDPVELPPGIAYTYQPLNPTTVWIRDPNNEEDQRGWQDGDEFSVDFNRALLRDLDTETVRIAVTTLDGKVEGSGGVVSTSVKGQSYVLIVDYLKYFASSRPIDVCYSCAVRPGTNKRQPLPSAVPKHFKGAVPVYVGIGLRIRAEFKALQTGLNISGLPALAIAATANGVVGRLTVQTLGITGQEVTGLVPLLSDISVASIQSAVQAVAAIKTKIYEDSTTIYPKVVGFESPGTDPNLVARITEELYATKLWVCPVVTKVPRDNGKDVFWLHWCMSPTVHEPAPASGDIYPHIVAAVQWLKKYMQPPAPAGKK